MHLLRKSPKKKRKPRAKAAKRTILERRIKLSKSLLWELQSGFYESMGITAWAEGGPVPFDVTTNAHIAHRYAAAALPAIDFMKNRRPTSVLTIVELGAGHVS